MDNSIVEKDAISQEFDKTAFWSSRHSDILRVGVEENRSVADIYRLLKTCGFTGCYHTVRNYRRIMKDNGLGAKDEIR